MDGYRDLYHAPGYYTSRYQPGYGVADPLYPAYTRVPLDAYAGYGAPVSYQPEFISPPRYSAPVHPLSPRRSTNPRRRPPAQSGVKRRPPPVQTLAPNRKSFKKTQKNTPVENSTPKKGLQRNVPHRRSQQKEEKAAYSADTPQKSSAATLAKETQDLHSLFRTGVDPSSGKKFKPSVKKADVTPGKKNGPASLGQKRKADSQKKDDAPSSAKKSRARGKNKKFAKEKKEGVQKEEKPVASTPKKVKVDPPVLTEEEKQEMEASLELQNVACKAVGEFLGVPERREEPEKAEGAEASADGGEPCEVQVNLDEAAAKSDEAPKPAPLTPEEEKELEAKGYQFFSKLLEDNQDLRKLYLDKKDAGTFECLVCHSVDPETSKKFANLTSLVMHTSMRKQKRPEHRGYGQAVCDVLGWESLRGPKRPSKQAKEDGDTAQPPEAEKVPEEVKPEEKQEGSNDE
eukprot:c22721_g1_i1 orf=665-2038(-)